MLLVLQRSKRETDSPHLEGLVWCGAPNVRKVSRIWRVWSGVALQTWEFYLVFGRFIVALCSICEITVSRLEHLLVSGIRARVESVPCDFGSSELRFAFARSASNTQHFVAIIIRQNRARFKN